MMKILHIIAKNDYEIHVFHQKQDFKLKKKSTQWYIIKGSIIIYTKWIKKGFFVYLTQIIHKEKIYFKGGGGRWSKDLRFSSLQVSLLVSTTLREFVWTVGPS